MKKFIFMFMAFVMSITMSAQTVKNSKMFDNTYIELNGGATFENYTDAFGGNIGLTLGKWVTPKIGFEIDGQFYIPSSEQDCKTFFSGMTLGANTMFNINNIIHGYKGHPDKFEVIPYVGIGWANRFNMKNDMYAKVGADFDYNINEKWVVGLFVEDVFNLTNNGFPIYSQPNFVKERSNINFGIGIKYNFKNSHGKRHHVICDKVYSQDEFNENVKAYKDRNEYLTNESNKKDSLIKAQGNEIEALKNRKCTNAVETVDKPYLLPVVGFDIGQSDIDSRQIASIETIAKYLNENEDNITIYGYADAETGSAERNMELSIERAESVKNALVKLGINENRIEVVGKGSEEQPFKTNNSNRVVIFSNK